VSDGFGSKLRAGDFVITAEISPPLSSDPEDLLEKAMPLGGLANAVNITDGASARVHMSALAAAAILVREGIEPVFQLTCRDRNRIALQSDLLGAAALGIRNLLILTGDDPSAGDQPEAKPVFDLDSRKLIETAVGIRDRHELPSGRRVAGGADFFIGVADTPLDPAPSWTPVSLRNKIAAGAQFAQTQFCMDGAITRRYMNRLAEEGITERVAPDRDQLWFPGLEHRRLDDSNRAGEVPARILGHSFPPGLEMPPTPTAIFPLTRCPGRRNVSTKQWARDDGARQWI
jgi:methylenetetrahydrofolate reductase (NADPH)